MVLLAAPLGELPERPLLHPVAIIDADARLESVVGRSSLAAHFDFSTLLKLSDKCSILGGRLIQAYSRHGRVRMIQAKCMFVRQQTCVLQRHLPAIRSADSTTKLGHQTSPFGMDTEPAPSPAVKDC
jgi:hypothetical protein